MFALVNTNLIFLTSAEHSHPPLKDIIVRNADLEYKIPIGIQDVRQPEEEAVRNVQSPGTWRELLLNRETVPNSVKREIQKTRQTNDDSWRSHPDVIEERTYRDNPWMKYDDNSDLTRGTRDIDVSYIPTCRVQRTIMQLENTDEYEYRPAYYEEIRCLRGNYEEPNNNVCTRLGFSCVEWNKTIHITRRQFTSPCWETLHRNVTTCECMWPEHKLGPMNNHIDL